MEESHWMNQIQYTVFLRPKPVEMSDGPGSCAAIQRYSGWRTEQAGLSEKCRVLGRTNQGSAHTGDQAVGRKICTEGPQGPGRQQVDHKPARHWCTKGRKQYPGLQDQVNWGKWPFSSARALYWRTASSSGPPQYKKHGTTESRIGPQTWRNWAFFWKMRTGTIWFVEKAQGHLINVYKYLLWWNKEGADSSQ